MAVRMQQMAKARGPTASMEKVMDISFVVVLLLVTQQYNELADCQVPGWFASPVRRTGFSEGPAEWSRLARDDAGAVLSCGRLWKAVSRLEW